MLKTLLDLRELEPATLRRILRRARALERDPAAAAGALRGKVLGLCFMDPSLRTMTSFQSGMARLGGDSFVVTPGQSSWQLEWRDGTVMDGQAAEHVREAIGVLEQYADALGVRCFAAGDDLGTTLSDPVIRAIAARVSRPLVNLESATSHPCQALADWKTLDDLEVPSRGGRIVLSWAWHPRALPLAVPASVLSMALLRGMEVTLLRPPGFDLPEPLHSRLVADAIRGGGSLRTTADRAEGLAGAEVIYAKSWGSPEHWGDPAAEAAGRAHLRDWRVDENWFSRARPGARFMHCLPVRRNVVVADDVLDGPRSAVMIQAGNRLWVQMALLLEMLGGDAAPPACGADEEST